MIFLFERERPHLFALPNRLEIARSIFFRDENRVSRRRELPHVLPKSVGIKSLPEIAFRSRIGRIGVDDGMRRNLDVAIIPAKYFRPSERLHVPNERPPPDLREICPAGVVRIAPEKFPSEGARKSREAREGTIRVSVFLDALVFAFGDFRWRNVAALDGAKERDQICVFIVENDAVESRDAALHGARAAK